MVSPKISVVIPTYNVESYICETIDSLLGQSCAVHEIIIINDGSTDRTLEVLDSNYKSRPEIKIFSQPNQGVGVARHEGLKKVTGDYVFFCDPDDIVSSVLFEGLKAKVTMNPELELYYFSRSLFVDLPGERKYIGRNTSTSREGWFESGTELLQDLILNKKYNAAAWQYMFKIDVADRFFVKFEGRAHEDHWFSMNIYLHSNKSFATQANCYYQRVRKGSLTNSAKDHSYVLNGYLAYRDTLSALKEHLGQFSQQKAVALSFMERNVSALIVKCVKNRISLPDKLFSLTRNDARECNLYFHSRMPILFPRAFFIIKKIRLELRFFIRRLRRGSR